MFSDNKSLSQFLSGSNLLKVEMGLTWIDHDTIEQPIEEISKKSDNLDIEFTVEKLRQNRDDVLLPPLFYRFLHRYSGWGIL